MCLIRWSPPDLPPRCRHRRITREIDGQVTSCANDRIEPTDTSRQACGRGAIVYQALERFLDSSRRRTPDDAVGLTSLGLSPSHGLVRPGGGPLSMALEPMLSSWCKAKQAGAASAYAHALCSGCAGGSDAVGSDR